jgi:hypothetical protein
MISCRNVAKLLTSDELAAQSFWKRAEVRFHLLMCKYCSRLARQIKQLGAAVRRHRDSTLSEDTGLEERLISKLSGRK